MLLGDAVPADRKPEPGAFAGRFCREERLNSLSLISDGMPVSRMRISTASPPARRRPSSSMNKPAQPGTGQSLKALGRVHRALSIGEIDRERIVDHASRARWRRGIEQLIREGLDRPNGPVRY
jgi:hypothetical protein